MSFFSVCTCLFLCPPSHDSGFSGLMTHFSFFFNSGLSLFLSLSLRDEFASMSSHRKWRESLFLLAGTEYYHARFADAQRDLASLAESASEDGDTHLECAALKWMAVLLLTTQGSSDAVRAGTTSHAPTNMSLWTMPPS